MKLYNLLEQTCASPKVTKAILFKADFKNSSTNLVSKKVCINQRLIIRIISQKLLKLDQLSLKLHWSGFQDLIR